MSDGKVVYEVRADDSNLDKDLDQANSKVSKGAGKMGKIVASSTAALAVSAATAAVKFGSEFEDTFAKASTLFGDTEVDVDNLQKKLLELSTESGIAATELNEGLYSALSAGVPITEDSAAALEFLESSTKLAKAGFTDVDTAISATAKTLNAYGEDIGEAERIQNLLIQTQNMGITTVDELGQVLSNVTPTAAAMNVSFEQVSASIANMTAQGTPAAQATTQLNSLMAELGKSGTKAQKGLEDALVGTEHAGKSFQDLMAEGVPMNEVLDLLGESAEKSGLTMLDMFGSLEAGKAALALSGKNSAAFTTTLDAMEKSSGSVEKAFEKVSGTTKDKFGKVMNQLKNTMITLFGAIEPIVSTALPILADLITALAPIIEMLFAAIAPVIEMALPILKSLLEALMPIFGAVISVLKPIIDLFIAMIQPILEIISVVLPGLVKAITSVINLAFKPVVAYLSVLKEVFSSAFKGIFEGVKVYIDMVKGIFSGLIDFVKAVFTGDWKAAWEAVGNIFGSVFDGMKKLFAIPINFIIDGLNIFLKGLNKIQVPDWVPGIGGKGFSIDPIEHVAFADGGIVSGPTNALVGEYAGANVDPEVIAPLSKLKAMLGIDAFGGGLGNKSMQSVNVVITGNTISEDIDINMIGDQFTKRLQNEGVL